MDWQAAYVLDPWGPERADLNAGIIAATLVNLKRDPRKNPKAASPQDFMPKYGQAPVDRAGPRALKQQLLAAFGGSLKRKSKEVRA